MIDQLELIKSLWTAAAGHAHGAHTLMVAGGPDPFNGVLSGSMWLLIGNAYETGLKSAFVLHGGDPDELKKIGHNLPKALAQAVDLGFPGATPALYAAVDALHQGHVGHAFRYLQFDSLEMPEPAEAILILEGVLHYVGEAIYPGLPFSPPWHTSG